MVYLYFLYKETFIPAIGRHLVLQLILFLTCVSAYQTTFKVLSETESVDGYSQLKLKNGDVLVFRLNVPVVVDISEQSSFHPFKVSTDQYDPSNTPSEDVLNVVTTASTITYTLLQATTPLYYLCGVVGHNFRGVLIQQVTNQDAIVTVSTRTPAEADALTQQVINADETLEFGALEATMSRVVDVASPAFVAPAHSVPVMAKIQEIQYDAETSAWTLQYETMKFDPDDILNHFHRILYFTRTDSGRGVSSGDLGNICIDRITTKSECANHLDTHYITDTSVDLGESLTANGIGITVVVSNEEYSRKQILSITIPHDVIRTGIGTKSTYEHPDRGTQTSYKFGVGILFTPDEEQSKTRVIMFDVFQLTENSWQLFTMKQRVSYSIAQYVSFWTAKAEIPADGGGNEFVTTANVEFTLDPGHTVDSIEVTINEVTVTQELCETTQEKINRLTDPSCIASYQLCSNQIIAGNGGATWVSIIYPVSPSTTQVDIDLFLKTTYLPTGAEVSKKTISTLNFQTSQPASLMCQDTTIKAFDPIQYTKATVYRGTEVVIDDPSSPYFTIHNVSQAASLPESLITLVIGPDDTTQATDYFARFSTDVIELDELYMSHALNPDNLPDTVNNKIYGTAQGRSYIVLDSGLVQGCMLEDNDAFTYQQDAFECVTTKDWPQTQRPKSVVDSELYFVHKFSDSTDGQSQARVWLQKHITGSSAAGNTEADSIISRTIALLGNPNKNSIYYIWPVYFWPGSSAVGLKDHTLISLSWSVSRTANRRLLSVEHAYGSSVNLYSKLPKKRRRPIPVIKPIPVFDIVK